MEIIELPTLPNHLVGLVLEKMSKNERVLVIPQLSKEFRNSFVEDKKVTGSGGWIPLWAIKEWWYNAMDNEDKSQALINLVAGCGSIEGLKWLHEQGCPWDIFTCAEAAEFGHLEVLEWLHEHGCPWGYCTGTAAANVGNMEVLKWLHDHGCPLDQGVHNSAAEQGDLEMLKWLHGLGYMDDSITTCSIAACGGQLEVLKWLNTHRLFGSMYDVHVCGYAASGGHLVVLKWLREQGFLWDGKEICGNAVSGGHLEVLKWLHEQGCTLNEELYDLASQVGNMEVLKWLQEHGFQGE
jgi:hypothetical protein